MVSLEPCKDPCVSFKESTLVLIVSGLLKQAQWEPFRTPNVLSPFGLPCLNGKMDWLFFGVPYLSSSCLWALCGRACATGRSPFTVQNQKQAPSTSTCVCCFRNHLPIYLGLWQLTSLFGQGCFPQGMRLCGHPPNMGKWAMFL